AVVFGENGGQVVRGSRSAHDCGYPRRCPANRPRAGMTTLTGWLYKLSGPVDDAGGRLSPRVSHRYCRRGRSFG
ncbi:MAG TPA: hypothetical protein VHH34_09245, partial [Pseudonocardiaceae bacterium]|nr:hypothetical protein [Pseudonocardiaceae bacterium]